MSTAPSALTEIFTVQEVARAAEVTVRAVRHAIDAGQITTVPGGYLSAFEAVKCVRLVRGERMDRRPDLFAPPEGGEHSPGGGLLASGAFHGAMLGTLVLVSMLGFTSTAEELPQRLSPTRLVFLATPGPGGGGGGGGLRAPKPPAKAELATKAAVRSPVPPPKPLTTRKPEPPKVVAPPPVPQPAPRPVDPPPPAPRPEVTPQVVAPVVMGSADTRDRAGVPAESAPQTDSQGSGSGGGAGSGQGTGLGEGTGAGIGPGSGGGTGGGPYRPGSGITAPTIIREVKPEYTDDARKRAIEGDVVLEIVVRRDGTVGDVKVLHSLGGGLDQRAIQAVRDWRFNPAKRFGTPVDVMVEVAVEFKLR